MLPMHWPVAQWACSCGCSHPKCWRRAKHPLVRRQQASIEGAKLQEWWERWPAANVGISARGLLIADLDVRPDHVPELAAVAKRWQLNPETLVVCRTGGGGLHLYFERPAKRHSKGKDRLGEGIDVQSGPHDFVTAPPSLHYNLTRYEWVSGNSPWDHPLPPTPAALLERLSGAPPPGWVLHVAPYWAAERLHLSVQARSRIRRVLRID